MSRISLYAEIPIGFRKSAGQRGSANVVPRAVAARLRSGAVILEIPEQHWECPNCTYTDVTRETQPHSRFHPCRGLKGLTAPMIPAGTRAKVVAHEREDYIGDGQLVTLDGNERPIMAVETVRDDGNDIAVFAPCVLGGGVA